MQGPQQVGADCVVQLGCSILYYQPFSNWPLKLEEPHTALFRKAPGHEQPPRIHISDPSICLQWMPTDPPDIFQHRRAIANLDGSSLLAPRAGPSRNLRCRSLGKRGSPWCSGMRPVMCFCLLTLLHFKVVPSIGWNDCSVCVKPFSFQGKLRYSFTYYQYLSPTCSTLISECTRGGTIYYKGKLTGLVGSCKNKGTTGQMVC
jgi:hypothetical protein